MQGHLGRHRRLRVAAEYCDILLTSVVKGMDVAVTEAIKESVDGSSPTSSTSARWRTVASAWRRTTTSTARSTSELKDKIEELKAEHHRRRTITSCG